MTCHVAGCDGECVITPGNCHAYLKSMNIFVRTTSPPAPRQPGLGVLKCDGGPMITVLKLPGGGDMPRGLAGAGGNNRMRFLTILTADLLSFGAAKRHVSQFLLRSAASKHL